MKKDPNSQQGGEGSGDIPTPELPSSKDEQQSTPNTSEAKICELTELLQRVQADFENYKKRVERDRERYQIMAEEKLLSQLLPILDAFELALKNSDDPKHFKEGVQLIWAMTTSLLEERGVKPIESVGTSPDPRYHEVLLSQKPSEGEKANIIIEEFQRGYLLGGKVLRFAKVKATSQ